MQLFDSGFPHSNEIKQEFPSQLMINVSVNVPRAQETQSHVFRGQMATPDQTVNTVCNSDWIKSANLNPTFFNCIVSLFICETHCRKKLLRQKEFPKSGF